jgi:hypothetical protein
MQHKIYIIANYNIHILSLYHQKKGNTIYD